MNPEDNTSNNTATMQVGSSVRVILGERRFSVGFLWYLERLRKAGFDDVATVIKLGRYIAEIKYKDGGSAPFPTDMLEVVV